MRILRGRDLSKDAIGVDINFAEKLDEIVDDYNGKKAPMSITGASRLGQILKQQIDAAKAEVAAAENDIVGAVTATQEAAKQAKSMAKAMKAEADDMKAQLGQFDNGQPDTA